MHKDNRKRLRPAIVVGAVAAIAATGGIVAACSSGSDQHVHCVDDSGTFVDPDRCDNDGYGGGGHYYYFMSSHRYSYGSRAPSGWESSRIDPHDSSARANAGLPRTGKAGGTTIRSGGFGRGGSSGS